MRRYVPGGRLSRGCPAFFLSTAQSSSSSTQQQTQRHSTATANTVTQLAAVHHAQTHTMVTGSTMAGEVPCEPLAMQGCGAGKSLQYRWRSASMIMPLVSMIFVLLVRGSSSRAIASATTAPPAGAGGGRSHCKSSGGSCSKKIGEFAGWRRGSKWQSTSRSSDKSTTTSATEESGRSRESNAGGVLAGGLADTDCCADVECGECYRGGLQGSKKAHVAVRWDL